MSENYMLLPFKSAAPFWSSILFAVSLWFCFFLQGWAILFVPILTLLILPLVDQYVGLRVENLEPDIEESRLFWYRLITLIWAPIQFITLFGILALAISADMTLLEKDRFILRYWRFNWDYWNKLCTRTNAQIW